MTLLAGLLAAVVILPFQAPHIDFANLPLEQQKAVIDVWRPDPPERTAVFAPLSPPSAPVGIPPTQIEQLIRTYFAEPDVAWALRVSWCESHWNPAAKNPTSSASGLFQHLARYWEGRSAAAGWAGADIFDPVANTAVAAWLYYTGGASHWVCK